MRHLGTDICEIPHHAARELMLELEIPLLNVGILAIGRPVDHTYVLGVAGVHIVDGRRQVCRCSSPVVSDGSVRRTTRDLTTERNPISIGALSGTVVVK